MSAPLVNFTNAIFAALALLSLALVLWQWLAARHFPLHHQVADPSFTPAVTLLKPLKGCDETTAVSLQSWFNQKYAGSVQILFGVADTNDPVCDIVRELIKKNPGRDIQLVLCSESFGTNGKISTLIQLERSAKYELILLSDADVRVPPDFLVNAVALLRDDKTALVNCFYRLANPVTTAMRWEAVAVNADFWSQALQAVSLKPLDFALGAAILVRRKALTEIGGFKSLANCLADDYQLGHRLAEKGHRLELCPVVVECWDAPMNWRDVWHHQLRWARTIRACQPLPYFFSILSNATFWPLLWLVISLTSAAALCAPLTAVACWLIRICLAQNLQRRFTPERKLVSPFWLVPVKDLLQVALWLGAFMGNTVEWRGQRMKLRGDGTLFETK
ncbi:MAG TPA: glycosyltransferase [Candidatus Limnocylindrales bacterium]|nr:glycosyltransferase [Candidatus Limnocylindrales bacterium]